MSHGTTGGYFNRGCRCDACRAAGSAYMRERAKRIGCIAPDCERPFNRRVDGQPYCWRHARDVESHDLRCAACDEALLHRSASGLCGFCEQERMTIP